MHYGDILQKGLGKRLIAYKEYGSYTGDYIAILVGRDEVVEVYKGRYGSCTGCDWLKDNSEMNYYSGTDSISDEKVKEFCENNTPFLRIERHQRQAILDADDISVYLPANTRNDYDEWSLNDLKELLTESGLG